MGNPAPPFVPPKPTRVFPARADGECVGDVYGGFAQAPTLLQDLKMLRAVCRAFLMVVDLAKEPIRRQTTVRGRTQLRQLRGQELREFLAKSRLGPLGQVVAVILQLVRDTIAFDSYGWVAFNAAARQHKPGDHVFHFGKVCEVSAIAAVRSVVRWSLSQLVLDVHPRPSDIRQDTLLPESFEADLSHALGTELGVMRMREWIDFPKLDEQIQEYRVRIEREMREAMTGTPMGYGPSAPSSSVGLEDWRPASWFAKGAAGWLRQASASNRRSKKVAAKRHTDGTKLYFVPDVKRIRPEHLPPTA